MVLPAASYPSTMLTVTRVSRMQGTPPIFSGSTVILSKAMPAWYAPAHATGRDPAHPLPWRSRPVLRGASMARVWPCCNGSWTGGPTWI